MVKKMTMEICYLCHEEKPCVPIEAPLPDGKLISVPTCKDCRARIDKERKIAKANMKKIMTKCEELGLPTYPAVRQANMFCETWWDVGNDLMLNGYTPEEVSKTAVIATGYLIDMIKSGMRGIQMAREIRGEEGAKI